MTYTVSSGTLNSSIPYHTMTERCRSPDFWSLYWDLWVETPG